MTIYGNITTIFLCMIAPNLTINASESAFKRTNEGVIEVKYLPASTVLVKRSNVSYFEENNLFMPLFWYITTRNIAMTSPVEVRLNPGEMYFFVGKDASKRELKSSSSVDVEKIPSRTVASIGYCGRYNQSNFEKAKSKLVKWIEKQGIYTITGEARAIYWDSPSVADQKKRAEVHIPILLSP